MVRHEAIGIIGAIAATGVTFVIVPDAHTVEGIDELVVVFLVLKDILMVVPRIMIWNIPMPEGFRNCQGIKNGTA